MVAFQSPTRIVAFQSPTRMIAFKSPTRIFAFQSPTRVVALPLPLPSLLPPVWLHYHSHFHLHSHPCGCIPASYSFLTRSQWKYGIILYAYLISLIMSIRSDYLHWKSFVRTLFWISPTVPTQKRKINYLIELQYKNTHFKQPNQSNHNKIIEMICNIVTIMKSKNFLLYPLKFNGSWLTRRDLMIGADIADGGFYGWAYISGMSNSAHWMSEDIYDNNRPCFANPFTTVCSRKTCLPIEIYIVQLINNIPLYLGTSEVMQRLYYNTL